MSVAFQFSWLETAIMLFRTPKRSIFDHTLLICARFTDIPTKNQKIRLEMTFLAVLGYFS